MTTAQAPDRNDPCHCGSDRKYKQCCLEKDEAAARETRAKTADAAGALESGPEPAHAAARPTRPQAHQPWKAGATNTRGFHKFSTPRKVGS
jgi:hypothetical protein